MTSVGFRIEQHGDGDLSWVMLLNDRVVLTGLTRTEAVTERWRLWWSAPAQRAAARERITGG